MPLPDPEDVGGSQHALHFEALKAYLKQDARGWVLSLIVNPLDLPYDLTISPLGTRYMVALVEVSDQGTSVAPKHKTQGEKVVQQAGIMADNPRFQRWLVTKGYAMEATEAEAADAIRSHCGIESRKELSSNQKAQEAFRELRDMFKADVEAGHG